jgi:hypothetical protein
MRELSQELVKAGIIEEMVGDSLPDSELLEGEDEEAETEVDKVLGEVLQGKLGKVEGKKVDESRWKRAGSRGRRLRGSRGYAGSDEGPLRGSEELMGLYFSVTERDRSGSA